MALKFFALLLVVCAVQARSPTAEFRAKYLEWLKNPVAQAHEKFHDRVNGVIPSWAKPHYEKYHDMILNGFNKPQTAAQEKPEVIPEAKPEEKPEVIPEVKPEAEKPKVDPIVAYQCMLTHRGRFDELGSFARNLLAERMNNIRSSIDVDEHPDLIAEVEARTAEADKIIETTITKVQELIDEKKIQEANECLNAGRFSLDDEWKDMVKTFEEHPTASQELFSVVSEEDAKYRAETFGAVTEVLKELGGCMQKGGN